MMPGASTGRVCGVVHVQRSDVTTALFAEVEKCFKAINALYEFDLENIAEPIQIIHYEKGEYINWHVDNAMGRNDRRKLSLSLQLSESSEYSGGDLEFADGTCHPFARERGAVTAFPSAFAHRVSEVTDGRRVALVAWMHGPPFR
jgi:PKHD-type hydroxylase